MIAQHGVKSTENGPPIRYEAVEICLGKVAQNAKNKKASIHMPRLGCGLAGGKWDEIESIIQKTLSLQDIPVFVYDLK